MLLLKQVVGIDVSGDSLAFSIGTIDQTQAITIALRGSVANTASGFGQLQKQLERHRQQLLGDHGLAPESLPLFIVMEASGTYYERLAVWMVDHGYHVSVVLPNTIKAHAKSDNRKSKTDRIDADAITHFGLEKSLKPWAPLSATMAELKALVREHETLGCELTQIKNREHALGAAAHSPKKTLKRLRESRHFLKKQLKQIEREIKELIASDPELKQEAEYLDSVPSVAMLTAATVLAETNRFEHVEHAGQLVSYTGIDPKLQQSGKYTGTVRISRKGNRVLRHALYMPALTAIRCNPSMRALYHRIVERTGIKKKGIVAVMRKLLVLMYAVWKKRENFNPTYNTAAAA
jgi:transposase